MACIPNESQQNRWYEMRQSVKDGNLAQLRAQLASWEAEVTGDSNSQADHLGFVPMNSENFDVYGAIGRSYPSPEPVDLIYFVLNRILVTASLRSQINIVCYILDERQWPISRSAIRTAMDVKAFNVLKVFLDHGWDINESFRTMQCPILQHIVSSEIRVRWCLEHGADPNARNHNRYMDVPSHAGRYASVQTLRLLAAYGANFRRSNALHHATEREDTEQVEVLLWLLDEGGFPINQREFEYDASLQSQRHTETALHYAVMVNSLASVKILLERGIDSTLQDENGRTARDLGQHLGYEEIVAMLDGHAI